MALSDQISKLFYHYSQDDKEQFMQVAKEIIQSERDKKHTHVANTLERSLFCTLKSAKNTKQMTPLDNTRETSLVEFIYPEKYFHNLVLPETTLDKLNDIALQYRNWDILNANGVPPSSKILFYGPPGCGKTVSAQALAGELSIPLLYIRFDAVVSSYLGETASNLRQVFEIAKKGCYVILFDEFDAIARSRGDQTEHGEIKRVVNTLLQQIDNFKGRSIVIACTNFEKSLDYAIWRRFDDTIFFDLPNDEDKIQLFNKLLQHFKGPAHCFNDLILHTKNFSHSDIEAITKNILRMCILNGKRIYSKKEIEEAVFHQEQLVSLRKTHY